jgi:hypothetical protein
MTTCLPLVPIYVVVTRWSKDLFIIYLLLFGIFILPLMIINRSVDLFSKENYVKRRGNSPK